MSVANTSWKHNLIDHLYERIEYHQEKLLYEELINKNEQNRPSIHLAIFVEPYLTYILSGKKQIESRFSKNNLSWFCKVKSNDILILKQSAGPVVGLCRVKKVWNYEINSDVWEMIISKYTKALCIDSSSFWESKKEANFALLMQIGDVIQIDPFNCQKKDRRAWVILEDAIKNY